MYGKLMSRWVSRIVLVAMAIGILILSVLRVYAYDFNAPHPDINSDIDIEATKAKLWNDIRSWGYSEAATAGLMGNIWGECSYNYTKAETSMEDDMSRFEFGVYGLGLIMWTDPGYQRGLFAVCDEMGLQWTDLEAQLAYLKITLEKDGGEWWSYGGNCSSLEDFMNIDDVILATDIVCWGLERPDELKAHLDTRREGATQAYEQFTGTAVTDLGSSPSGNKNNGNNQPVNAGLVVSEWDLAGMSGAKGVLAEANAVKTVELPDRSSLSNMEDRSVWLIKDSIETDRSFSIFDTIRVLVVFLGLCTIVFAVMLGVAYIFDRTNNIIEISLISIISFGLLKYCDGDCAERGNYVTSGRVVQIGFACIGIGLFLVSGGLFTFLYRLVYRLIEVL